MKMNLTDGELNYKIAEQVFGFEWWRSSKTNKRGLFPPDYRPEWFKEKADLTEPLCFDYAAYVPNYLADLEKAILIVGQMFFKGFFCEIKFTSDRRYRVRFQKNLTGCEVTTELLSQAICGAALAALRSEK